MFRIEKILNHNSVIGIRIEDNKEYLIIGKGIAFGKKVSEKIEANAEYTIYSLNEFTEHGRAKDIVDFVSPECLGLADEALNRAVRECVSLVEKQTGKKIDILSLSYNRLINHVRYMIARTINGEKLKVSMNDYMEVKFPKAFHAAKKICTEIEQTLKLTLDNVEIGYLAIHIERVMDKYQ